MQTIHILQGQEISHVLNIWMIWLVQVLAVARSESVKSMQQQEARAFHLQLRLFVMIACPVILNLEKTQQKKILLDFTHDDDNDN